MNELRKKINKLLDECTSKEILEKIYEHILFIFIHIYDRIDK